MPSKFAVAIVVVVVIVASTVDANRNNVSIVSTLTHPVPDSRSFRGTRPSSESEHS